MIIVEGPDNSGKSTLISKLLDLRVCVDTWHAGGPGYNVARLKDELCRLSTSFTTLHDRSNFISGPVYEQAFDNPNKHFNFAKSQKFIEHMLDNNLLFIVYCTGAGPFTARKEEDEEYNRIVQANDKAIRFYYNDFFEHLRLHPNVVTYNFNEPFALDKVVDRMREFQNSFSLSLTEFTESAYVS